MISDTLYLKCVPRFGDMELYLTRCSDKFSADYILTIANSPQSRWNNRFYALSRSIPRSDVVSLITINHPLLTIRFENQMLLLNGSSTAIAQVYLINDNEPMDFYILPSANAGVEFRNFESLFLEQESLGYAETGTVFQKKLISKMENLFQDSLGQSIKIIVDENTDTAASNRALQALQAITDICNKNQDYKEAFLNVDSISIRETDSTQPIISKQANTLNIQLGQDLYNSYETLKNWIINNL